MPRQANTDGFPSCGKCGAPGSQQRRNGRQAGKQRYQCLSCRKTWTHSPQIKVEPLDQDIDQMDQDDEWIFTMEDAQRLAEIFRSPEWLNSEACRQINQTIW